MAAAQLYAINPGWRLILVDLGLRPADVLRRAELPADLFGRERATLHTHEYFRLWRAIDEESEDGLTPLRIGAAITIEAFDPAIFASLCSPELNTALRRLAHYKRLICPMVLHLDVDPRVTQIELEWLDATLEPPVSLVAAELVFFVQLARIATRSRIAPLEVQAPHLPEPLAEYREFFGVPIGRAERPRLVFRAVDARRPFLTANESMWRFFEPELQARLSELDRSATTAERTRAALLELLPSGTPTMEAVAGRLGTSTRTLQRHLRREGHSFQAILNETRERLARHYLKSSRLSGAEISFLLGFDDPNSFFRAFHNWTGTTPEQARQAMGAASGGGAS
ncbi:MAG: AraC family transcriptional regulator ligand-binding domain-containing protein [Myxococcales bacterium]|nr:AraC family transcriptional regulator ligand-binding domain-containing protein [Myxococcales bacterium]